MNKISFYDGNIKNTKHAKIIEIGEFVNFVKYGTYKNIADCAAEISDKKERQKYKAENLPYITTSGVFSERSSNGLLEHSGLIAIDIDGVENMPHILEFLTADPHTFIVFKSVSGTGLCVIVKITPNVENHLSHFRWLSQYYYDQYSIVIDESCKDVSRARFISFDPDIYVGMKSKIAGKKVEQKTVPKKINWIATETQMHRIVSEVYNRGINIADSYNDYLICALAIADGYGETGRQYFHACASVSSKYNEAQANKKYNNALKTHKSKVKIGSFFYLVKKSGIELRTNEESTAFAIAKAAKKNHSPIDGAIQTAIAAGVDPVLTAEIAKQIENRHDLDLSDKEIAPLEEAMAFIRMNTKLRFNAIKFHIENDSIPIDDRFLNSLYLKTKIFMQNNMTKHDVKSIINSDFTEAFDPIKDWYDEFKNLPSRPEVVDQFINTIPFEDHSCAILMKHWLIGIPASYYGEVVRLVLCFIGEQETGKTHFFRNFLPEKLNPKNMNAPRYYAESSLMKEGDDAQIMAKNLIVMDDELGGKSQKDAQKFKELTSKEVFTLRLPYGETICNIKRLALLCGTANDFQIINDTTGNTRMLPIEFNSQYDFETYNSIDKNQLLVEIFRLYENGATWKLSTHAVSVLDRLSLSYQIADFESELIDAYLDVPSTSLTGEFLSSTEIKIYLERCSNQKILSIRKLGIALNKKFDNEVRKIDGKTKRGYRCVTTKNSPELIEYQSDTVTVPF